MTLVAWVVAEPLFLAYFGKDSACVPSPRSYQSSFYPHNPTCILLLRFQLTLDVEYQV